MSNLITFLAQSGGGVYLLHIMYLVFWMYLGVCLLLVTRGTPRLYGTHKKVLRRIAP